jgi:RNA polymerase sigma-70 factor (ECF subfamily)
MQNKDEFLEIIKNYQGIIYKVSLVYFKQKSEVDENVQEVIYQLWKSYTKLKNHDSLGSWIYAVSINTSLSRIKKNNKVDYREQIPESIETIRVEDKISKDQKLKILLDAIHKLDEVAKSIILLYLEEKSYAEIAEIIGISISNVGVKINRAKEQLLTILNIKRC